MYFFLVGRYIETNTFKSHFKKCQLNLLKIKDNHKNSKCLLINFLFRQQTFINKSLNKVDKQKKMFFIKYDYVV